MKLLPLSLGIFVLLAQFPVALQAADAPLIYPAEPADLLKVLPQTPQYWTLIQSEAQSTLSSWLQTRAVRVFQAPPPTDGSPGGGSIEIAVVDTGGFRPALGDFADFKPGKNGLVERLLIGGYPALQIPDSEGNPVTQVLLASRYIVEVKVTALPRERVEAWLHALHFDALPAAVPATSSARPSVARLSSIDELHPGRNRSYSVSVSAAPVIP